ncbi:hypothetical protein ACRRTK_011639 [Alexandromys fortis]
MSRDSSVCVPSLYLTSPPPASHHSLVHILLLCVFFSGIPTEAIISLMSVDLIPSYMNTGSMNKRCPSRIPSF